MRSIQRIRMPGLLSFPPDMDFFELRSLGAMFGDIRTFRSARAVVLELPTLTSTECRWMPEISRFFGIVVAMYYGDHLLPHVHAKYAEQRISVAIEDARILSGDLPGRARALLLEWLKLRREELLANWALAQERKPLNRIDPLE